MEDEITAGDRLGPALVLGEVRRVERQPFVGRRPALAQGLANLRFARETPHRRADFVPIGEQAQQTMTADEPGPAGDQNPRHVRPLQLRP